MNSQYMLVETEDRTSLQGKDGRRLISFVTEGVNLFKVYFYNDTIDDENLYINAENHYGRIHKLKIGCVESQIDLCKKEFIKILTGPFLGNSFGLMGMDWGDFMEITSAVGAGKFYYRKATTFEEYKTVAGTLIDIINTECADYNAIVCFESGIDLKEGYSEIEEILNLLSAKECLIQYFWNENMGEERKLVVWSFEKDT